VSGKCPNRGECFSRGKLGLYDSGRYLHAPLRFLRGQSRQPGGVVDRDEPNVWHARRALKLRHVVVHGRRA